MSYEVQLQYTLLYYALAVREVSLLGSKFVLSENGGRVSDFCLPLYKRSDDSQGEKQLLYLTWVYQPQCSRCFLPDLDCVQLFVSQHRVW
ncbi:hypothetical protein TNCV_4040921 [Trichonephila clavipes]|nr:hypothetical protein TNCV_4040921 [Trichonephila clavipes]